MLFETGFGRHQWAIQNDSGRPVVIFFIGLQRGTAEAHHGLPELLGARVAIVDGFLESLENHHSYFRRHPVVGCR